jgi:3-dehydroquinate synthase
MFCLQGMTKDEFKQFMAVDKKVQDGQLRLILLKGPLGQCVFTSDFAPEALEETIAAFTKPA